MKGVKETIAFKMLGLLKEDNLFSNGLTTADLNTEGKQPVKRESLITEVKLNN